MKNLDLPQQSRRAPEPAPQLAPLEGFAGRCESCYCRVKSAIDVQLHGNCSVFTTKRSRWADLEVEMCAVTRMTVL